MNFNEFHGELSCNMILYFFTINFIYNYLRFCYRYISQIYIGLHNWIGLDFTMKTPIIIGLDTDSDLLNI